MGVALTRALRAEYERLFETCVVRARREGAVGAAAEKIAEPERARRYREAGEAMGIPWYFIGVVHRMECGGRFDCHLHNGDSLRGRTMRAPKGRPRFAPTGEGYTWEESARDALGLKRLGAGTDWSLAGVLYQLERYNGFGYRMHHPEVLSPYLWSFSEHYARGKYAADGVWSDTLVSRQCGAAVILRRMRELGMIEFADQPATAEGARRRSGEFRPGAGAERRNSGR